MTPAQQQQNPEQTNADRELDVAEGWRPQDGDVLRGEVVAVGKAYSEWTESDYPLLTVRADDGRLVAVHAFHDVLRSELMNKRPVVGEQIAIKYHGKRKTRDGKREVSVYAIHMPARVGDGADVWSELGAAERKPATPPDATATGDDDIPF